MQLFDLSGDVAVVIGATGVLGGAMAEGLASAGANVAVLGRNEARGQARVQAIYGSISFGAGGMVGGLILSLVALVRQHERSLLVLLPLVVGVLVVAFLVIEIFAGHD